MLFDFLIAPEARRWQSVALNSDFYRPFGRILRTHGAELAVEIALVTVLLARTGVHAVWTRVFALYLLKFKKDQVGD